KRDWSSDVCSSDLSSGTSSCVSLFNGPCISLADSLQNILFCYVSAAYIVQVTVIGFSHNRIYRADSFILFLAERKGEQSVCGSRYAQRIREYDRGFNV